MAVQSNIVNVEEPAQVAPTVAQATVVGVVNPDADYVPAMPPPSGPQLGRSQSFSNALAWFNTEVCRTGPIVWTYRRLMSLAVTPIFIIIFIVRWAVGGSMFGDDSSGGDGSSSSSSGCFVAGTRVKMADGMWQCIEHIHIGDRLAHGGRVTGRMEFEAASQDLYHYPAKVSNDSSDVKAESGQVIVSGRQAVWEESLWRRVSASPKATPIDAHMFRSLLTAGQQAVRVFDVDVETHQLLVLPATNPGQNGAFVPEKLDGTRAVVFSDFSEVDNTHHVNERCDVELLNALEPWRSGEIEL